MDTRWKNTDDKDTKAEIKRGLNTETGESQEKNEGGSGNKAAATGDGGVREQTSAARYGNSAKSQTAATGDGGKIKTSKRKNHGKSGNKAAYTGKSNAEPWLKALSDKNVRLILGALLIVAGAALMFYVLYRAKFYISSVDTWKLGIILNIAAAMGISLVTPILADSFYENWKPENSDFYYSWKETWSKQQKKVVVAGGLLLAAAVMYLNSQMRGGYYYYPNFASGYLTVATVAMQFAVLEFQLIKFMRSRLDMLMECVSEINKDRLREAVELEKKSIEKAAKSEQLKIDLISNVSHDLKTPLTSMVGYLELLKKEDLNDVSRDYAELISDKAEKLKEMIESLFSLAKASSGNIKIKPETIELNRLIEQIFADMDDRIKASGLHFVTAFTEEDTRFTTDSLHMYRICQNLVENALKYSASGTRVFVKTFIKASPVQRKLYLEITNTAGYFMDFSKEEIVERFARGDKARTSEGNGLGLAIVSTYAGALGGSFDINIDCDQFKAVLCFPLPEEGEEAEKK